MTASLGSVPGTLIDWAAGVIGISPAIVRAQINEESGGQPGAVSSAGAQGVAQFIPSTWQGEGCTGSPFNVNDAMKCYAKYMYQLVRQFHGNVRDALAAYNAGPGNLQAGYGYADTILAAAGQPQNVSAGGGSGAVSTTAAVSSSSAPPDATCALSVGGQHVGLVFGHGPSLPSACLFRKTELRALMGGVVLAWGGVIFMGGVILLAAFAFRASGAARVVAQAASVVPGAGGVAASAEKAAPKAAAAAKATPKAAPRQAPARQPSGDRKVRTGRGQVSEDFAARYGTA